MDLGKTLSDLASTPLKIASAGLEIAGGALSSVQHALGDTTVGSPVMSMLGLDDTLSRAGRLTRLVDDDAPLGRALAPGWRHLAGAPAAGLREAVALSFPLPGARVTLPADEARSVERSTWMESITRICGLTCSTCSKMVVRLVSVTR